MKKFLIGILALIILLSIGGISFYSSMVSLDENLASLDSQIGNMYSRRADLIPQIAGVIKAAASYEGGTLKDVTELRGASQNLTKLEELQKAGKINSTEFSALLATTMGGMKLMSEQYPTLQAVQGFRDMTVSVEWSENRLRTAIKDYNDSIAAYNTKLRSFPYGIFFGNMLGFTKKDRTYDASIKNQTAPTVIPNTGDLLK